MRHGVRRSRGRSASPTRVRGRVALGAGQVAVVAVLAVVGLALTCWWLVRSAGHEVVAPTALRTPRAALATPDGVGPSDTSAGASRAAESRARVVVDVAGKVRRPGIAVLRQGARVVDALRAAGGARPGVDLGGLNLARVLTDGEQVVVGQPTVSGPVASSSGGDPPVTGLVNINTADETTLESLPEVGPVTAQAIITWRTENSGFSVGRPAARRRRHRRRDAGEAHALRDDLSACATPAARPADRRSSPCSPGPERWPVLGTGSLVRWRPVAPSPWVRSLSGGGVGEAPGSHSSPVWSSSAPWPRQPASVTSGSRITR